MRTFILIVIMVSALMLAACSSGNSTSATASPSAPSATVQPYLTWDSSTATWDNSRWQ